MKKTNMYIFIAMSCLLCACSNNTTPNEPGKTDEQNTTEIHATEADIDNSVQNPTETSEKNDDDVFFNMRGIQMKIPNDFEESHVHAKSVWNNKEKTIRYDIDFVPDYISVYPADSYDFEDTPDIMWEYILEVIDRYIPAGKSKSTYSVDTEEMRSMVGYDVIRRTGTIHAEKFGESHELNYAAYYGLFDFQDGAYQKVPTVWIAFSETEEVQKLEEIVDLAFDNAELKK